jgi:hypothetical protein
MTSPSAPGNQEPEQEREKAGKSDSAVPAAALDEGAYLRHQSAQAKAAISGALADLKTDLAKGVDPRLWMKSHPWVTLASAAVAGFATAAAVVPNREEQALRKLAAIQRAVDGARNGNGKGESAPAQEHSGFVGTMLKELVGIVKPIALTLLTEHLKPQGPEEQPGRSTSEPA